MSSRRRLLCATIAIALAPAVAANTPARALLPPWLQHVVGASNIESALYRAMQLPGVRALYPRPAREAQTELAKLSASAPEDAALYELRARADEQALDETAAERDWRLYTTHAKDTVAATLELAAFYQRRMLYPQEIAVLNEVAAAPSQPSEMYLDPSRQRSWVALERILTIINQQGMPPIDSLAAFNTFLTRYPDQPAVYAAALQFDLDQKDWTSSATLIARYQKQFPNEATFPVRAQALLEYRRGNIDAALAVYDHAFQPLWSADLVQSYLDLLNQTHRQRAFVASARRQLAAHPDGLEALNALARIVYYDQQAGRNSAALQTLEVFRIAREDRKAPWTPDDLLTLAQLSMLAGSYAEAARYQYALAATAGTLSNGEPAAQSGLAGLIHTLLAAPDQPLAIGAANLTLYRDIATLDQGPGYWNGILSLWLNGESPATEYASESAKAQSYFNRSKAADLLADLDKRFPSAPQRPALHAELLQALTQYGDPAAIIDAGKQFLATFPAAPERLQVADSMAEAYAQQKDTASEFALYESQLTELAAKTGGLPLTAASTAPAPPPEPGTAEFEVHVQDPDSVDANATPALALQNQILASFPGRASLPEATAYARVLDRYLGRLTATGQLPRALTVLRQQLDRNPNDPLLYERLSSFLQQNNLSAQQEELFQLAIAKFQQPGYYDKLARFYLRMERRDAFAKLTHQVTDIFSGTDLDAFFAGVTSAKPIGPQLAVELNLYAAKRFPHDLVFTRNLLAAYQAQPTRDPVAYEALLRTEWWASDDLRDQFFAYLSRTGKLQAELSQLHDIDAANPAAQREQAELDIFTSHFEQAATPLGSIAELYPADADTGDRAVSLFRSLAYLDPTPASTTHAVAIEKNLLAATPDSLDRLATLGDLYAEATSEGGEDLTSAAPFWHRIPELHPGSSQGFLTSSTIFWDYFQFDDALAELTGARTRFHADALFGYEAGAIAENRHDLDRAVTEYTNAVIHPLEAHRHFDSGVGVIRAWLSPPSDAADSNLRSTTQSFLGSEESRGRLLQLATRASTRSAVDEATSRAVAANPTNTAALTLRADILAAQHAPTELAPLLSTLFDHALDRAATVDEAAAIGELAQARSLTLIYERALAKQAAFTLDPVQKIELQYTLARSLESRDDIATATRIISAIYTANPRLLGVVRATTDFYDRTGRPQLAIGTLLEASQVAVPSLAHDFTLEAADRANRANDTAQARSLALTLLAPAPYDARVLAVIADSYARTHDDGGLRKFYLARLDLAANDPALTPDGRRQNIAVLRRGLIPALTRLHDAPAATAQYIALLSAYPEDTDTAQEAALYSLKHATQPQLLDFLRSTVKQSPRDSRFMVLLAQIETTFEDLPAAGQAYSLAIAVRSDRVDLYAARAAIETRLSQTDPAQSELAAADFQRLYKLSYHDPAWMLRLAELRARQGRREDAVNALKTAYIAGHAETAADLFTVAAQLADWNLLPEARTFAERGVAVAGSNLLTPPAAVTYPEPAIGAVTYTRILTRLGMADHALATLVAARHQAAVSAASPSALAAALAKEEITDEDAESFRKSFATRQKQAADQNLQSSIKALGNAVQTWYTPEQKQALALTLDKLHDPTQPGANPRLALQVAAAAGLTDRESAWRQQALLAGPLAAADVESYTSLQRQRLQLSDLAHTLERYAARLLPRNRRPVLVQAAQAYRDAAETANEIRVTQSLVASGESQLRDRYFHLLLSRNPPALTALASGSNKGIADAAVNYSLAHGTQVQALAAVSARGQALAAVWRPASASLVETYFADPLSVVASVADFTIPLASTVTIGDRLGRRPDPTQQLTGSDYFFYSARFGIFLSTVPKASTLPDAEDFLAAELEAQPTSPTPYLDLARTYAEAKDVPGALTEYNHALELAPSDPAILDELATALYRAGRHDEAIAQWTKALAQLRRMQEQAMYPESWFTSFETIARHLGERHLAQQFRPALETILAPYFAKNGSYRSNELLESIYDASASPTEGVSFILTLSHAAQDPDTLLRDLNGAAWLDNDAHEAILLRRIELARSALDATGAGQLLSLQRDLLTLYLDQNRTAQAQSLIDTLSPTTKATAFAAETIVLAVHTHRLQPLLDAWQAAPDSAPSTTTLASSLTSLQAATSVYTPDPAAIRPLQEFFFTQKDQAHTLIPTDFLALAQTRIDASDTPGALQLLQRLSLLPASANDPAETSSPADAPTTFANLDHASDLLERNHLAAEAIPFLRSLVQLIPWSPGYRLRLAAALSTSNAHDEARTLLVALAADTSAPYSLRIAAARALAPLGSADPIPLGSAELTFIAHPTTSSAARQPYFVSARLALAATSSTSVADRQSLLREAIAIQPTGNDAARARLDLLLLQPEATDPSLLLALYHSLQDAAQSTSTATYDDQTPDNTSADPGPTEDDTTTATRGSANHSAYEVVVAPVTLPAVTSGLDVSTRIHLALKLSAASESDGDQDAATAFAQLAVQLAAPSSATLQATAQRRQDAAQTAFLLARRNALRQPILSENLAQSIQVRPRLTAADIKLQEVP